MCKPLVTTKFNYEINVSSPWYVRHKFSHNILPFLYYHRGRTDAVLYPGQWSEDGCETVFDPTRNRTICRCNHLTHFAILLSARPLNLSPGHSFALEIIGYVGVSVSLVAMAATVLVFLYLK